MNTIFNTYAPRYYDMGYYPFPTGCTKDKLKAPFTKDRSVENYDLDKMLKSAYSNSNIGIGVGHQYGIVALDLDIPNKHMGSNLEKKIREILPTSSLNRVGQPGRSLYFFKSSKDINVSKTLRDNNKNVWVEFLTNGKFVVVPPSIHPLGHEYFWVEDNLLDYTIEDLPDLSKDIYDKFDLVERLLKKDTFTQSKQSAEGGRNTALTEQAHAFFFKGEFNLTQLAQELYDYDQVHHRMNSNGPLFDDEYGGKGFESAFKFSVNQLNSHVRQKSFSAKPPLVIEIKKETSTKPYQYKTKKLLPLRGVMGSIFDAVYDSSIKPRSHACFASSLVTFSTIVANKYHLRGIHPNIYALLVMDSGEGKNTPIKFPNKILNEISLSGRIGDGSPSGDTAVIAALPYQPIRVDCIDEIGGKLFSLFKKGNSPHHAKISDAYAELYSSCGSYFAGKYDSLESHKKKMVVRKGECFNPFINIFGATTFEDFKKTFNTETISKGLGGRFLFFPDDEKKRKKQDFEFEMPRDLINELKEFNKEETFPLDVEKTSTPLGLRNFKIPEFKYSNIIKNKMIEIDRELEDIAFDMKSDDVLRPIYNRSGEYFLKLALLDALSLKQDSLTTTNIEWAFENIKRILSNSEFFLRTQLSSGYEEFLQNEFENFILLSGHNGLNLSELCQGLKKLSLKSSQRKEVLVSLLDSETIFKKDKQYIHKNFVKNL